MSKVTELYVNGTRRTVNASSSASLLSILREQLDLTGTKYGCGEGQCGACTVLIDGFPRRSCITPMSAVAKKQVTTIEGIAPKGPLHPVQEAFLRSQALQCGYCTPGMILTAIALLHTNPNPTNQEIIRFMEGNICRCGTYPRIIAAIHQAAGMMKKP